MTRRLTRAEKRQITYNLFGIRLLKYMNRYVGVKNNLAINEWRDMQGNIQESVLKIVDSGIEYDQFIALLTENGFQDFEDEIYGDLLTGYTLELEDIFPDLEREEVYNLHLELQTGMELR